MTAKATSTKWEDYTAEEKQWFADEKAKSKVIDDEKLAQEQANKDLKASAKAKLIAGEKLTEEEANILVGV